MPTKSARLVIGIDIVAGQLVYLDISLGVTSSHQFSMGTKSEATRLGEVFGARLQTLRKEAGLTQQQLAGLAECSPVTISKLETGVNLPTLDVLLAVAIALNASPDRLVGWPLPDRSATSSRDRNMARLATAVEKLPADWIKAIVALAERAADDLGSAGPENRARTSRRY